MACCSIIIRGWVPFAKYWGPGPQDWWTPHVATEHRDVRQDSLPVNVSCRRDSLSVTDSGSHSGTTFEAPFVNFARQNLDITPATSQRKSHAQNFGRMSFGGTFQPGALRTCVPCLMVNPALSSLHTGSHFLSSHYIFVVLLQYTTLQYNCLVFRCSTVTRRKCEINIMMLPWNNLNRSMIPVANDINGRHVSVKLQYKICIARSHQQEVSYQTELLVQAGWSG